MTFSRIYRYEVRQKLKKKHMPETELGKRAEFCCILPAAITSILHLLIANSKRMRWYKTINRQSQTLLALLEDGP